MSIVNLRKTLTLLCVALPMFGTVAAIGAGPAHGANGQGRTLTDLNYRSGPGNPSPVLGTIPVNTTMTINCVVTNYSVAGPFGASSLWDQVSWQGRPVFVSDAWMWTGSAAAVAPTCGTTNPATPVPGPVLQPTCNPQQVGSPCGPAAPTTRPAPTPSTAERAAQWAEAHLGSTTAAAGEKNGNSFTYWSGMCEVFAEDAYRLGASTPFPSYATAAAHRNAVRARLQGGVPPRRAIVLYTSTTSSGHVAIPVGNGNVIGTIGYWGRHSPSADSHTPQQPPATSAGTSHNRILKAVRQVRSTPLEADLT